MYHSVYFGDKNTFDDWHLVPLSRPVIAPAQPKLVIDDIPGGNGSIDLSQTLTGLVNYYDRSGDIEFLVLNDHDLEVTTYGEWYERYSNILNYLQGKRMKLTLEDDPDYYYIGRFAVSEWKSQKDWSNIVIDYRVDPFKYSHKVSELNVTLGATSTEIKLVDLEQPVVPEITPTNDIIVNFNNRNTNFPGGETSKLVSIWPDDKGETNLLISGSGTVNIKYRCAKL